MPALEDGGTTTTRATQVSPTTMTPHESLPPTAANDVPRTSDLPIDARRLTAEIRALDASSLLKSNANV